MSTVSAWQGTRLVAARAMADGFASKPWRVITAVVFVLGLAVVLVPRLVQPGPASYTLAVVEGAPPAVTSVVEAAAAASGFSVEVVVVPDRSAAQSAVAEGSADAAFVPNTAVEGSAGSILVPADAESPFPAIVAQAAVAAATEEALQQAGLDAQRIAAIQSIAPPVEERVGAIADEDRRPVGFVVGIVLYMALILTGTSIASAVAVEKTTRISEVLLAVLRPTQLLVGTVLGVGLLGLVQVLALGLPIVVGLLLGDGIEIPAAASGDIALGVVWFVLGLALYAFVFAALATLVQKVTEVGAATMPVNIVLIGSYLLAVIVTANNPTAPASVIASLVPFSAPMVMPIRWATGFVPGWQLALSMLLTAATAFLLALLASRIYARGLSMTGRRLNLRDALRRA